MPLSGRWGRIPMRLAHNASSYFSLSRLRSFGEESPMRTVPACASYEAQRKEVDENDRTKAPEDSSQRHLRPDTPTSTQQCSLSNEVSRGQEFPWLNLELLGRSCSNYHLHDLVVARSDYAYLNHLSRYSVSFQVR